MKTARFVVFQDKKKQWRWHLKAANGRVIAQGEAHSRKQDAERAYKTVRRHIMRMVHTPIVVSPVLDHKTREQLRRSIMSGAHRQTIRVS